MAEGFAGELQGLLECSVCLEQYDNPKMLKCAHEFCKQCVEEIATFNIDGSAVITCPLRCTERTILEGNETVNNLASSYNLKNVLDALATKKKSSLELEMPGCEYIDGCTKHISLFCCNSLMCKSCFTKHTISEVEGGVHKHFDLSFNNKNKKLMVLCGKHSSFCTHLCGDNKLLCVYCLHRDEVHKHHTKNTMENEVASLKLELQNALSEQEHMERCEKLTRQCIDNMKKNVYGFLQKRKKECMALYESFLEEKEDQLKNDLDEICKLHIAQYYSSLASDDYQDMLCKKDIEIILQKEKMCDKMRKKRQNISLCQDFLWISDKFDYLSNEPLGKFNVLPNGNIANIDSPTSTLRYSLGNNKLIHNKNNGKVGSKKLKGNDNAEIEGTQTLETMVDDRKVGAKDGNLNPLISKKSKDSLPKLYEKDQDSKFGTTYSKEESQKSKGKKDAECTTPDDNVNGPKIRAEYSEEKTLKEKEKKKKKKKEKKHVRSVPFSGDEDLLKVGTDFDKEKPSKANKGENTKSASSVAKVRADLKSKHEKAAECAMSGGVSDIGVEFVYEGKPYIGKGKDPSEISLINKMINMRAHLNAGGELNRKPLKEITGRVENQAAVPGVQTDSSKEAHPRSDKMELPGADHQCKVRGNQYFKERQYTKAVKCYTEAIKICKLYSNSKVGDLDVYYQNRAAANEELKLYGKVVEDCFHALRINPGYVKAKVRLNRALEQFPSESDMLKCLREEFGKGEPEEKWDLPNSQEFECRMIQFGQLLGLLKKPLRCADDRIYMDCEVYHEGQQSCTFSLCSDDIEEINVDFHCNPFISILPSERFAEFVSKCCGKNILCPKSDDPKKRFIFIYLRNSYERYNEAMLELSRFTTCVAPWVKKINIPPPKLSTKMLEDSFEGINIDDLNNLNHDLNALEFKNSLKCVSKTNEEMYKWEEKMFSYMVDRSGCMYDIEISRLERAFVERSVVLLENVVDFSRRYHSNNSLTKAQRDKSYIFESGGIPRVNEDDEKVNLFEKDSLIIPIIYEYHWYLVIVCFPGKAVHSVQKKEPASTVTPKEKGVKKVVKKNASEIHRTGQVGEFIQPCILVFDSAPDTPDLNIFKNNSYDKFFEGIRNYLTELWAVRNPDKEAFVFDETNLKGDFPTVPGHNNIMESSVCLIYYYELFFSKRTRIQNFHLPLNLKNWMQSPLDVVSKRKAICRLIDQEHAKSREKKLKKDKEDFLEWVTRVGIKQQKCM